MPRAGSGRSGYWKAASFTFASSANDGKAASPYSPCTRPPTVNVPDVFTLSKSWAYTAGTSERMLRKSVLGALNARSSARFSPADCAEPETVSARSLRRSSVDRSV